jgi:hypothetical protein
MGVIVRTTTPAAGKVLGFAKRLGKKALLGTNQNLVDTQVQDGLLIRVVRNGGNVIVTILDLPSYLVACTTFGWVGPEFTGEVHFVAFDAPGSRGLFYQDTSTLDVGQVVTGLPHKFSARITYGAPPAGAQAAHEGRGLYSHGPFGVCCVQINMRGAVPIVSVGRASSSMVWLADTVTPAEIAELGTADKNPSTNRVGLVEFPQPAMGGILGGRNYRPTYSGKSNLNHVCELSTPTVVGDVAYSGLSGGVVAANTFDDTVVRGISGLAVWRYLVVPPPAGSLPSTKPTVSLLWGFQLDVTTLAEPLLVPTVGGGEAQPHTVLQTVVSATLTDALLVFSSIVSPYPGDDVGDSDGGIGVTVVRFNPVTGAVVSTVSHARSTNYHLSAYHYYYLPLLNFASSLGPRVASSRSRVDIDAGGYTPQAASSLCMVVFAPDGTELVLATPGYFTTMYDYPPAGGVVGTFTYPATGLTGQAVTGLHPSVCLYAEDVLAVVVSPNAEFGSGTRGRYIALVDAITGGSLGVRALAYTGDTQDISAITCPKLAVWGMDGGNRVELVPGSLLLTVSRQSTLVGPDVRGVYLSNDGGTTWSRTFATTSETTYYLGPQFSLQPMDALN